jgi:hypothetical protein
MAMFVNEAYRMHFCKLTGHQRYITLAFEVMEVFALRAAILPEE